jgi:hypothetical protein
MKSIKPGILLLVRRAKVPVVIAGIAGGYQAWPMHKLLPMPRPLFVHYTTWEWPQGADDKAALASLQTAMAEAYVVAEKGWRRIGGRYRPVGTP